MSRDDEPADFCAAAAPDARALLAERQLAALAEREAIVRAFVCYDAEAARHRLAAWPQGPLSGALIGVKDIIATADFPTRYGATHPEAPAGPRSNAWCVDQALGCGGILFGKTVCTEFAFPRPGPTTNPHAPHQTPGGSSSGSAAAVAAGFVSFALGTQTAGSTIRPASYCGVIGFKPSHGLLPLDGVQQISTTCDHLGIFARSPRDAWYFASALMTARSEIVEARRPSRLLVLLLPKAVPQGAGYPDRLAALATALSREGIATDTLDLPFPLEDFRGLQQEICYWEAARLLLKSSAIRPLPELRALLQPYLEQDMSSYAAARTRRQAYQAQFATLVQSYDGVLVPAATGVAPALADTGDAVMSRFWTALHLPAITVPLWRSEKGLPLGLQLLGGLGTDRHLIATAQWLVERGAAA